MFLCYAGARLNQRDYDDDQALHVAARGEHVDTIKLLIEQGARVRAKGKYSRQALHWAAKHGHLEGVELLLEKTAQIDAIDVNCNTPLHFAAQNGQAPVMELLLARRANPNAVDHVGRTPLHYATAPFEHAQFAPAVVARLLIRQGANVNAAESWDDQTPLHVAVAKDNAELVELLINNNADTEAKDKHDNTPLRLAVMSCRRAIVELVLELGVVKYESAQELAKEKFNIPMDKYRQGQVQERSKIQQLLERYADNNKDNKHS